MSTDHAEHLELGRAEAARAPDPRPRLLGFGAMALSAGALGIGALGLVYGDFALQWQPVPETVPARRPLAYAAAILTAGLGAALLVPRLRAAGAAGLTALFLGWTLLHLPGGLAAPAEIGAWLGVAEILALACAAFMLTALLSPSAAFQTHGPVVGRIVFGACLPVFGASHLVYPDVAAGMIPAFIPAPLFWAYFTGACHIAAGAALMTGVLMRAASILFAVMVSGFVLLLHVPRVIGEPTSRHEWTMLAMASMITAAAWCVAAILLDRRRAARATRAA